ncbi:glycosyltransferase family 25 protein [Pseudaminobacter soli (ex Li et al. 2025)]|nr:glycosyltransferase family 25 protein [Mesorhizobium soli]
MTRAEAFVIHVKRAVKRRPQVDELVTKLPLATTIIDAVDGETLDDSTIDAHYKHKLHRPHYPFELRRNEIACFLSHRLTWQTILDRGLDAGLIVEDDVQPLDDMFPQMLKLALETVQPGDFIRFPYRAYTDKGERVAGDEQTMLVQPKLVGLGMQMQLVGREAAAELLKVTEVFDRPVDTTIQMRWLTQMRILATRPVAIREINMQLGGSVVQYRAPRPKSEVFAREIKRALYRISVRALSMARA